MNMKRAQLLQMQTADVSGKKSFKSVRADASASSGKTSRNHESSAALGAPFVTLLGIGASKHFQEYRRKYRSFRQGASLGAHGELDQFRTSVAPVSHFISNLYAIVHCSEHSDCVTWNEEGTQVHITNIESFSTKVLPKYFRHKNFRSFLRQLNMYNFRLTKVSTANTRIFSNPNFMRNNSKLLKNIKRKRVAAYSVESRPKISKKVKRKESESVHPLNSSLVKLKEEVAKPKRRRTENPGSWQKTLQVLRNENSEMRHRIAALEVAKIRLETKVTDLSSKLVLLIESLESSGRKHSVDADSTLLDDSIWSFSDYDGQGNAAAAEKLTSAAEHDEEEEDDEENGDVKVRGRDTARY